jgi:hypothetical protein
VRVATDRRVLRVASNVDCVRLGALLLLRGGAYQGCFNAYVAEGKNKNKRAAAAAAAAAATDAAAAAAAAAAAKAADTPRTPAAATRQSHLTPTATTTPTTNTPRTAPPPPPTPTADGVRWLHGICADVGATPCSLSYRTVSAMSLRAYYALFDYVAAQRLFARARKPALRAHAFFCAGELKRSLAEAADATTSTTTTTAAAAEAAAAVAAKTAAAPLTPRNSGDGDVDAATAASVVDDSPATQWLRLCLVDLDAARRLYKRARGDKTAASAAAAAAKAVAAASAGAVHGGKQLRLQFFRSDIDNGDDGDDDNAGDDDDDGSGGGDGGGGVSATSLSAVAFCEGEWDVLFGLARAHLRMGDTLRARSAAQRAYRMTRAMRHLLGQVRYVCVIYSFSFSLSLFLALSLSLLLCSLYIRHLSLLLAACILYIPHRSLLLAACILYFAHLSHLSLMLAACILYIAHLSHLSLFLACIH